MVVDELVRQKKKSQLFCCIGRTVDNIGIIVETVVSVDSRFVADILLPELGVAINALVLTTILAGFNSSGRHFKYYEAKCQLVNGKQIRDRKCSAT